MAKSFIFKRENFLIEGLTVLFLLLIVGLIMNYWLDVKIEQENTQTAAEEKEVLGISSKIYYVDAIAGNDANAGNSQVAPFKSLSRLASVSLQAGDKILFKAGQTHTTNTNLTIYANGTSAAPIIISSYGDGAKPTLQTTDTSQYDGIINLVGDYIHIDGLYLTTPAGQKTETAIRLKGQYQMVANTEISGTGLGISVLNSANHTIRNNHIHDLQMIVNDSAPDNDNGATAVLIANGSNVEIYENRFINLQPTSTDYGHDGSAIETYDSASNITFYRNYVENVDNFSEIGGSSSSSVATNVTYHSNVIVNPRGGIYFHLAGTATNFGVTINNIKFEQNTVYRDRTDAYNSFFMGFSGTPGSGVLSMRNNLLHLANYANLFINIGQVQHSHNLFKLANIGNQGFTAGTGEIFATPSFIDVTARNFALQSGSAGIDAGTSLGYELDYLKQARNVNAKPDIGAYEFQTVTSSSSSTSAATTSAMSICKADYNSDAKVDVKDLSIFAQNYQKAGISCSLDLSGGDCVLNSSDFTVFTEQYKSCGY